MKIINYSKEHKIQWNDFTSQAKNSHFFFQREYMDYHADRFLDYSLLVLDEKEKVIAVLPANREGKVLHSHQGLTFGGFIVSDKMKTEKMLEIFDVLQEFLKAAGVEVLIYKCMPYTYHITPAEEDKYALFRNNARLVRRDVSSTIDLTEPVKYSKGRKWTINKAKKEDIKLERSTDYDLFWGLLLKVLKSNHGSKPAHNLTEIVKLSKLFPSNIELFLAKKNNIVLAGVLIYNNKRNAHTQYLANSEYGREVGALDLLIDYLIRDEYQAKRYFDFGISNEKSGLHLNTGLIAQKEGFGARPVVHDFYELLIK